MQAVARAGLSKDYELRRILDEVSPKNIDKINKLLVVKDEEIAKLKDEITVMTADWKMKTKELESQVLFLIVLAHLFLSFTMNSFGIKGQLLIYCQCSYYSWRSSGGLIRS